MSVTDIVPIRHWKASAALIQSERLSPTLGSRGTKEQGKWGPATIPADQDLSVYAKSRNIGFQNSPTFVDVDIDGDNPVLHAALDLFLPFTQHVYGRASRPRTHRLYAVRPEFDPLAFPQLRRVNTVSKVEVRGSSTRHSVLPGSLHSDGEHYLWQDLAAVTSSTPAIVEPDALVQAIRLASAAHFVASNWVEGQRNNITLALTGALFRIATSGTETGPVLTKAEAKRFLSAILDLAGDDESSSRLVAFENTWRKCESGSVVTGLTRYAELIGDPDAKFVLPDLLSDDPTFGEMQDMYDNVYMMRDTGRVVDIRELGQDGVAGDEMSLQNFKAVYANQRVARADGKYVSKADVWVLSPQRITIRRREFNPSAPPLAHVRDEMWWLNYWTGFAHPARPEPVPDSDVEPLTDYLWHVIADRQDYKYQWLVSWMGDIFAWPARKPGTALVLVGGQRIGKSFLGSEVLGPIIGHRHYVANAEGERLTQNFNRFMSYKLLIQLDEAVRSQQKAKASILKSFITDPRQIIEAKGIDAVSIEAHARFLFTTNETTNAVFLDRDDSRYTVLKVSDCHKQDTRYFGALSRWLSDNFSVVHRWLVQQREASMVNLRIPLATPEKGVIYDASMSLFDQWLYHVMDTGQAVHSLEFDDNYTMARRVKFGEGSYEKKLAGWPMAMALNAITTEVNNFLQKSGSRDRLSPQQVKAYIESTGIFGKRQNHMADPPVRMPVKMHKFPTLEAIRQYIGDNDDEAEET